MNRVANPKFAAAAGPAALTAAQRTALRAAVKAVIDNLPADQEFVSVHDIAVALRENLPAGIAADQFDGSHIRAHLAALGIALV